MKAWCQWCGRRGRIGKVLDLVDPEGGRVMFLCRDRLKCVDRYHRDIRRTASAGSVRLIEDVRR